MEERAHTSALRDGRRGNATGQALAVGRPAVCPSRPPCPSPCPPTEAHQQILVELNLLLTDLFHEHSEAPTQHTGPAGRGASCAEFESVGKVRAKGTVAHWGRPGPGRLCRAWFPSPPRMGTVACVVQGTRDAEEGPTPGVRPPKPKGMAPLGDTTIHSRRFCSEGCRIPSCLSIQKWKSPVCLRGGVLLSGSL